MPHALNMFVPIKRDPETLKKLEELKRNFATDDQPKIEKAARESKIIHFLRVLIFEDRYLVVLTEYDGGHLEYAEFFRNELPGLFERIFSLAEVDATWSAINNEESFFAASKALQVRSLGQSEYGETDPEGKPEGYLFSAYGNRTVEQILPRLAAQGPSGAGSNTSPTA